jgi:hypothetical protein
MLGVHHATESGEWSGKHVAGRTVQPWTERTGDPVGRPAGGTIDDAGSVHPIDGTNDSRPGPPRLACERRDRTAVGGGEMA